MSHSSTIYLGTTQSSFKEVSQFAGSPETFPAGTAARLKSDGTLSKTKAHGSLIGVSLGKTLSDDANSVAIVRAGLKVPILLTDIDPPNGDYTYVAKGAAVWIDDVTCIANKEDDQSVTTTITNAIYASDPMDAIDETGNAVKVALIDMVGGL